MSENMQKLDHVEIDLLLPWYVNDTLEPAEHDRVAAHITTCATCQENVSLLSGIQSAVVRNKATPIVPQPQVDDFLNTIDAGTPSHQRNWRQPRSMIAAAVAALLLMTAVILSNRDDLTATPQIFETATSMQQAAAMDYVLSIQFEPGTLAAERARVLQDIQARDISGGIDEGAYRVIVQLPAASLEELERHTSVLESMPEIRSVNVVALQLPVSPRQ